MAMYFFAAAFAFLTVVFLVESAAAAYSGKVLLVSMDGFRWDYIKNVSGLNNFSHLADIGCTVDYITPAFATKTFPCHYTIATGLYEETHGIISNHMYDPERNATFGKLSKEPFWWNGGEPLWVTVERQNKSSGVYFWPGSEAEIRGYRPSVYLKYNESVPFPQRVDTAVKWLAEDKKDLVMLYFHEPDRTGHNFGPSSTQVADKVREMDGILGLILNTLKEKKLTDKVNVIITSDHGMTDISPQNRLRNLWNHLDKNTVDKVPDSGIVTFILPKAGREDDVITAARKIPNAKAYLKADIPDHFHYKNNPRVTPIIIISDEGWLVSSNVTQVRLDNEKGDHGYNNDLKSMKAIFFATGPDFRKGVKSASIRAIDIYPLVCRLLNIEAAPNNGSLDNTAQFLTTWTSRAVTCCRLSWLAMGFVLLLVVLQHV